MAVTVYVQRVFPQFGFLIFFSSQNTIFSLSLENTVLRSTVITLTVSCLWHTSETDRHKLHSPHIGSSFVILLPPGEILNLFEEVSPAVRTKEDMTSLCLSSSRLTYWIPWFELTRPDISTYPWNSEFLIYLLLAILIDVLSRRSIVTTLEWNQSNSEQEDTICPFAFIT